MSHKLLTSLVAALSIGAFADNSVYVAKNGSDFSGDGSSNNPYASLAAAVSALGDEGGTIYVRAGTYTFTTTDAATDGKSCFIINTPVKIVGATGNPADVVFKRDSSVTSARVFRIDNAGAGLRYVTVQNGYFNGETWNGGNVYVGSAGGTIEDCVLTGGNAGNINTTVRGGGNLYMSAGRCARCVITDGKISFYRPIGLNVFAEGSAIVENCLITKGLDTSSHTAAVDEGAVVLKGSAKLINCTVVDNSAQRFSGVHIMSTSAYAINCIIACNSVVYEGDVRADELDKAGTPSVDNFPNGVCNGQNKANFLYCATDLDTSKYAQLNNTCVTITEDDFVDAQNGDWRVRSSSAAIQAGSDYSQTGATSETDLLGNPRTKSGTVDIGCYQNDLKFDVRFSASSMSGIIPSTSKITFTANPFCAAGPVTYTWDFGDGSTVLQTTETTVEHEYSSVGSYTVFVTAADGTSSVSYLFPSEVVISSFSCEFVMVTTNVLVGADAVFRVVNLADSGATLFTWNFGDGSGPVYATETEVRHPYSAAGSYNVSVVADAGVDGRISYEFDTSVDVIQKDIYVNTSGSSTFPYDTPAKGAKSPETALIYAADGCVVHILPATYDMKNKESRITRAIRFVGEGGKPEDVVLKGYGTNNGKRNLYVQNDDAYVANLTLDGGFADGATGGNLYLGAGTVTNCILRNGRSNSSGGGGGGAFVKGGILTHCVITNSYLGNRGNGIALQQTGGRVSNCLIGYNKREWLSSRNAFSVCNVTGGVIDNCTIAGMSLLKYSASVPFQMGNKSDTGFNLGANARAYNCAIADFKYYQYSDASTWGEIEEVPARCLGTAANFVKCVTDDATPVNATCSVGTTATMFQDYANGDLTPGPALKNKGGAVEGYASPSVDLAGLPRLNHAIDVGCYEKQPVRGMSIICR